MKRPLLAALASLAAVAAPAEAAAAGQAQAQTQAQAQAQRDWTETIVPTPEGGFRMGNPDAALKIVGFVSLTCSHCAVFLRNGQEQLIQRYVRTGRASFEIRNLVINPIDRIAALVNRCAAPQHHFQLNGAILSEQVQWFERLASLPSAEMAALNSLDQPATMIRIARIAQLDRIAAAHGVTADRLEACLSDRDAYDRLSAILAEALALGVEGAPSFLVNGVYARDVHHWAGLEPLLRAR